MNIQDYVQYICSVAETVKKTQKKDFKIIDGIGDVKVNGNKYQIQILLEPNEEEWVHSDKPTLRIVK